MIFLSCTSDEYQSRLNVLVTSILKYHPNAYISTLKCTKSDDYVPYLAQKRLKKVLELFESGFPHVICLGADCELFGPLTEVEEALKQGNDAIIIPHIHSCIPQSSREFMARLYRTGHANGDIVVFKNTPNGIKMLKWLISMVKDDQLLLDGSFYEQTWLSALPFLFDHVHILRDHRYNVAYWTLEAGLSIDLDNLKIFHYSGFIKGQPECFSKHYPGPNVSGQLLEFLKEYDKKI